MLTPFQFVSFSENLCESYLMVRLKPHIQTTVQKMKKKIRMVHVYIIHIHVYAVWCIYSSVQSRHISHTTTTVTHVHMQRVWVSESVNKRSCGIIRFRKHSFQMTVVRMPKVKRVMAAIKFQKNTFFAILLFEWKIFYLAFVSKKRWF